MVTESSGGELYDRLINQLKKENSFIDDNGQLKKWVVLDKARTYSPDVLALLLKDEELKKQFFVKVEDALVFKADKFIIFLEEKTHLNDSFTRFENQIGLSVNGKMLKKNHDVELVFPYKDCILEGGQTKENDKRNEIFFNTTLAQDEITQLLDIKVLTNAIRYDKEGKHAISEIKPDDNLIIKGNNLIALHCLKEKYAGKVKLIYIDPPYNTGNDSFGYNDSFTHSTWLTFMKNRLEIARDLLRDDGVIFVQCDDNEQAYLKILMDEIFKRENFVNCCVWQKKNVVQNDAKYFNENHDFIIVMAKNKQNWRPYLLQRTEEMNKRYANPDNDIRGEWTSVALQAKSGSIDNIYEITFPNGVKWKPVDGTYPRLSKNSLIQAYNEGRLWFGKNGKNVPRLKKYLIEVKNGLVPNTIFANGETGSTQTGKEELKKLLGKNIFTTPKPELLLKRILEISTQPNDIILDFFVGSGTTAAVAHKMNRQYIGIEQMDYINTITLERMQKVIAGEQGGISKYVNWKGGGSFVYCELKQYNKDFLDAINSAQTEKDLINAWEKMKEKAFFRFSIKMKELQEQIDRGELQKLDFLKQKELLFEILDANQMYVNYSDINNETFKVSDTEKQLTKSFYTKGE